MAATVKEIRPKPLLELMAEKFHIAPEEFKKTIKKTCGLERASDEEFLAFLMVAHEHGLNPFLREIYAFQKTGGGFSTIIGVDGWYKLMNRHPAFNGIRFFDTEVGGQVSAVRCVIWRKDRQHYTEAIEYLVECRRNTDPWQRWPRRMLRHKAAIQCIRITFGLAGVLDPDEFERYEQMLQDQKKQIEAAGTSPIDDAEVIPSEEAPKASKETLVLEPEEPVIEVDAEPVPEEPEEPKPEPLLDEGQQATVEGALIAGGYTIRMIPEALKVVAGVDSSDQIKASEFMEVLKKIKILCEDRKRTAKEKKK